MIFIDFYILAQMMFFDFLRKPTILYLAQIIGSSFNHTQNNLQTLFNTTKYDLSFNGQTIYLEHYLNDQFDNDLRRIYIEDTDVDDAVYLFNEDEGNEDTYLFNTAEAEADTFLRNTEESLAVISFIVYVPSDIVFNMTVMRKHVQKYAISGFNFEIEIV